MYFLEDSSAGYGKNYRCVSFSSADSLPQDERAEALARYLYEETPKNRMTLTKLTVKQADNPSKATSKGGKL